MSVCIYINIIIGRGRNDALIALILAIIKKNQNVKEILSTINKYKEDTLRTQIHTCRDQILQCQR